MRECIVLPPSPPLSCWEVSHIFLSGYLASFMHIYILYRKHMYIKKTNFVPFFLHMNAHHHFHLHSFFTKKCGTCSCHHILPNFQGFSLFCIHVIYEQAGKIDNGNSLSSASCREEVEGCRCTESSST